MSRLAAVFLACATTATLAAQTAAQPATLTLDSAAAWTLRRHPLALAAEAVERRGPAELMRARGAFDPTLRGSYDRKDYLGTEYFEYGQAGLDWQTPFAVKLEAGREWAEGVFLNAERTVPDAGQAYLGVKLPLLRGLLVDKYRTGVRQGEVAVDRNRAAAEVIRNELRYDLAVAYTEWARALAQLRVYEATEDLLADYLANTRGLVAGGEKPAVDTVEAALYLTDQQLTTQQAAVEAQLRSQDLTALYFPLAEGLLVPPEAALLVRFPVDLGLRVTDNPELAELRAEIAQLELERRLKREYLKPQLDVGYAILGDGFQLAPDAEKVADRTFLTRAYKVGAEFRYPIPNRAARGDVRLADIKLAEAAGKLEAKRQQLVAKATANRAAALQYEAQLVRVDELLAQARALLAAERELFELGESTQFLLNQRAQNVQKAQTTRLKLLALRAKAIWAWRQAMGAW